MTIHEALHALPAFHQSEAGAQQMGVVGGAGRIEQMHRRQIAFAALRRRHAAHAADRERAGADPCSASAPSTTSSATQWLPMMTRSGISAAWPMSVTQALVPASSAGRERIDLEEPVGLREAGDRARALGDRKRDRAALARDQRHQHELLAAELGGDAHRHLRLDGAGRLRRQPCQRPDDRGHESVEGEDRRGREARQHHQRLAVHHREAQRLAGLERHPMHQDAGRAQPRHHPMREIAGALGGAAGQQHQIAARQRVLDGALERGLVVRDGAERIGSPPASMTAAAMMAPLLS